MHISTLLQEGYFYLKVLSYWNLNGKNKIDIRQLGLLKVLSYWNLNNVVNFMKELIKDLKYYHIGI